MGRPERRYLPDFPVQVVHRMCTPQRLRNLAKYAPEWRSHVPAKLLPCSHEIHANQFTLPIMRAANSFSESCRETGSLSAAVRSYGRYACGNYTVSDFPLATSSNACLQRGPSTRFTDHLSSCTGTRRGLCASASGGKLDEPFERIIREYETLAEELKNRCEFFHSQIYATIMKTR